MSDTFNGDPQHTEEASWAALRGSMGPVHTQPAGLNMDQGAPASAANTSEAPASDTFGYQYPHQPGIGGGAANAREDNQNNVF